MGGRCASIGDVVCIEGRVYLEGREVTVGKSVCIAFGSGCPRSQAELGRLYRYFETNGWETNGQIRNADLVMVSACGVDNASETVSIPLLEAADRKRKAGSKLVVLGCLAGINPELIQSRVDALVIPPVQSHELDALIGASVPLQDIPDQNPLHPYLDRAKNQFSFFDRHLEKGFARKVIRRMRNRSNLEPNGDAFTLQVSHGCTGECTYCAIRFAEGPLRSKPLERIRAEFEHGLQEGYREFKILAGDIGAYGQDMGSSVVELMRTFFSFPSDFRLTLLDISPQWFVQYARELTELFEANIHRIRLVMVPVQSGSEQILSSMKRGYTAAEARQHLTALRERCPGLCIATHALVGFPGETEQDVQDTVSLLHALKFDRIDVYEYGDRPKTEASLYPDKISDRTKRHRSTLLKKEFSAACGGLEV